MPAHLTRLRERLDQLEHSGLWTAADAADLAHPVAMAEEIVRLRGLLATIAEEAGSCLAQAAGPYTTHLLGRLRQIEQLAQQGRRN